MLIHLLLRSALVAVPLLIFQLFQLDGMKRGKYKRVQKAIGICGGCSLAAAVALPILTSAAPAGVRLAFGILSLLYAGGMAIGIPTGKLTRSSRKGAYFLGIALSAVAGLLSSPAPFGAFALAEQLNELAPCICTGWVLYVLEQTLTSGTFGIGLQEADRLFVMSELAASIAHEVRNPLTVVRGFIQMAQAQMAEQNRVYMQTAIDELDRAEAILSDYLSLAKPSAERVEILNASDLVRDVAALAGGFCTMRGIVLTADVPEAGPIQVQADPQKLKQAVLNLLKNAVEATPYGGTVRLEAGCESGEAVIRVIDSGEGMTSRQLQRLGEAYYSTKAQGTGIGLTVVHRLLRDMNGRLTFASAKGRGTTATVRLPEIKVCE